MGIEAVKYLYKYITKGHDRAYLALHNNDETVAFVDAHYIGAPEGRALIVKLDLLKANFFSQLPGACSSMNCRTDIQQFRGSWFMRLDQKISLTTMAMGSVFQVPPNLHVAQL